MGLIRFILAISVITAHSSDIFGLGFVGGELAVILFFMISGFYMALVLNEKYIGKNGDYKLFIKNRLLRLFPLYYLVLICAVVIMAIGYQVNPTVGSPYVNFAEFGNLLDAGGWIYLVTTNCLMVGMDASLFLGLDEVTGSLFFTENFALTSPRVSSFLFIPQSWSVAIELLFYLIAPLIVRKLKTIILLLAGSAIVALILVYSDLPADPWNYRFFPAVLLYFMLGSLGYITLKKIKNSGITIPNALKWSLLVGTVALTVLFSRLTVWVDVFYLSVAIVGLYSISIPVIFDLTKHWKIDRFIGELSYSIYMIHMLVLYCLSLVGITQVFVFGLGETVAIITVVLSIAVQKLFIEKIERFRMI